MKIVCEVIDFVCALDIMLKRINILGLWNEKVFEPFVINSSIVRYLL